MAFLNLKEGCCGVELDQSSYFNLACSLGTNILDEFDQLGVKDSHKE